MIPEKDISLKTNETNNTERIYFPELDGLRFFAFLLVFFHHSKLFIQTPHLSTFHAFSWIGVDLFFVLSAFLFTKLLIAEYDKTKTISFKKFYIRRIFRIWPIYYLFITFCLLFDIYVNGATITKYVGVRIIGLFTFSDNLMASIKGFTPVFSTGHLWTIGYEEQFYVFIPIIIFFLVRASLKTKIISTVSVFILFNAIRFFLIANKVPHPAIWVLPITHFEAIIMGIIIGFGGLNFLAKKVKPLILGLIGILFFILLTTLPNVDKISYWLILSYSLVGISTSMILLSVSNSIYLKRIFSKQLFVFLGKRSYGLYVYHLLGNYTADNIIKYIPKLPSGSFAVFMYSLAFTILIAIISYKVIEKPFLKLKKKFEVIVSRPI